MLKEVAVGKSFLTKDIGFCRLLIGGSVRCLDTFTSSRLLGLISKLLLRMIEIGILWFDSGVTFGYSTLPNREGDIVLAFFHAGAIEDIVETLAKLLFGDCDSWIKDTCVVGSGRWLRRGLSSL